MGTAAAVPGLSVWRSSVSIGSWADAAAGRGRARRPSETAVFSDSTSAAVVSKSLERSGRLISRQIKLDRR